MRDFRRFGVWFSIFFGLFMLAVGLYALGNFDTPALGSLAIVALSFYVAFWSHRQSHKSYQ
jgi:ABC-type Mn2+/Zn2+ transport system permease subunit